MKNKTKAMWIELVGGIFGWIWIGSFFGSIYFLIQAALYDGSWLNLAAVIFAGVISKAVLRESEDRKSLLMTHESVNFDGNGKFDNVDDKKCHKETEKIVQQYGEFLLILALHLDVLPTKKNFHFQKVQLRMRLLMH